MPTHKKRKTIKLLKSLSSEQIDLLLDIVDEKTHDYLLKYMPENERSRIAMEALEWLGNYEWKEVSRV